MSLPTLPTLLPDLSKLTPNLTLNCSLYLTGLIGRVIENKHLKPDDREFILYSGHITNEMGLFDECKKFDNVNYYTIEFGIELLRNCLGICLSRKCNQQDWAAFESAFQSAISTQFTDPSSQLYNMQDYFVLSFTQLHPSLPSTPPLADSYIFYFLSLISITLLAVIISSLYLILWPKRRDRIAKDTRTTDPEDTDVFEARHHSSLTRPLSTTLSIQTTLSELFTYNLTSPMQATVDLCRFIYSGYSFAYLVPFIHAAISKISVDTVENNYYNTGAADANLQIVMYLPDGFLFISGYVCSYQCLRKISRIELKEDFRRYLQLAVSYVGLVFRRWMRLAVFFSLGMIFAWKILPLISTGPLQSTPFYCTDTNFFSSLLMINNNFAGNDKRMCAVWYWYFAVDIRLYLILPAIIFIAKYGNWKYSVMISATLAISSFVYSVIYQQHKGIRELHGNNGLWMVDVMPKAVFHGTAYFLGVAMALLERQYAYKIQEHIEFGPHPSGKPISRPPPSCLPPITNKSLPADQKRQYNRLCEGIAITSLILFIANYLIYYYGFQNDNIDISKWPQWRHTLWNTVGVLLMGLMPVFTIGAIFYRWGHVLIPLIDRYWLFGMIRCLYFDMYILSTPFLLVLLFNLTTVPFFDQSLVNNSILWETPMCMLISILVHILLSRPLDRLIGQIIGV
jgi:hypothetical protein